MKISTRYFLLCVIGLCALSRAGATTLIYPVEGIEDLWKLNAEDFRQKYGGINVTGLGIGDEGWYVRYRHENLTYFFGPVADREEAQKRMWELELVRDAAIRNDPKLNSSQVDFVRFNFSGIYGKGGNTPFTGKGKSDDGKSGPEGDIDGDGIANKDDPDMDGDGIPNGQDGDVDGDGIPNGGDKYPYGSSDGVGNGNGEDGANADGKGGKDGKGDGKDGQLAGNDGTENGAGGQGGGQQGNQKGQKGSKAGGGEGGNSGDSKNPVGAGENGMQQVASAQGGGSSGGQRGTSGQKSGQSQSGQQGSQSGQQAGQQGSQSGGGGSGTSQGQGASGSPGGQSGGSGSPLDLVAMLLRKILGL